MKHEEDYLMLKPTLRVGKWELRKSEFALCETRQQHESQRRELLQASQWADQAQRERMNLCGELERRNRLHHESQVKTKRSKNYEQFAMKKQLKFEDHNLKNCLCNKKEIRIL